MRKITAIIVSVAICLSIAGAALLFSGAGTNQMAIVAEVKQTSAKFGDSVNIVVSVKNDHSMATEGLGGIQYELPYDSSKLTFESAQIDPELYAITENFGGEGLAAYAASDTDSLFFYNVVDETNPANSYLRFISVCKAANFTDSYNGYSDLGKNTNGNYSVFTAKFTVADASLTTAAAIPLSGEGAWISSDTSESFTVLGTQVASAVDLTPEAITTQPITSAILDMYVKTFGADNQTTITLYASTDTERSNPLKTISAAVLSEDEKIAAHGTYVTDALDLYNLSEGTYYIVISKPFHLDAVVTGITVTAENTVRFNEQIQEIALVRGDTDLDGFIGMLDLSKLIDDYQKTVAASSHNTETEQTDIDGDGNIGMLDLSILISGYQKGESTYSYGE